MIIILSIFVVSGSIFLVFLGFGLYGLSRILIYFNLGDFNYNKGFYDNLFYYGSYIVFGYFIIFTVEYTLDIFRKKLKDNPYFQGVTYHLISFTVITVMFYFVIHINYTYVSIDFWVIVLIIGILYMCKLIFYPDSENLNKKR